MKHLRKFNESNSSEIDVVEFIMSYAPYLKSHHTLTDLFGFKDHIQWKGDEFYHIKNFCRSEVIRGQIFFYLDKDKLRNIYNKNIQIVKQNQQVFNQLNYILSLDEKNNKQEISSESSTISMMMVVLDEKIDTEFIILLKMYLILKRLVWNKAEFIEDSLIELDDNRIEYDVILTSEFGEPGWSISFSTKDTSVQKHAIVLNILSQIDKRIKGKGLFRVSSNGSNYNYHITQR